MSVTPRPGAATVGYDVAAVRAQFPCLAQEVHGHPLAYLDNAATTQKPERVLQAIDSFYRRDCSNVHRGVHLLSERATAAYEGVRERVRSFLGARSTREIVFVRGTTEAVNLVAHAFARPRLRAGDELLVTTMEHHGNLVPWQMACEATGAKLRVVPVSDAGELDLDAAAQLLNGPVKLFAVAHVSNVLGTINPVRELVALARARGVPVLVDGAQATCHGPVDVQALGCDFYAFSAHKMYGPMGAGVLWGREEVLEAMPPWQGGGDMIASVTFEKTTWNKLPHVFEAGTPDVAAVIGLGAAIDWLVATGFEGIATHEAALLGRALDALREVPGLRLIGEALHRAPVVSFVLDGVHPHDIGTILDRRGVAIRTGHHCAEPLTRRFGVPATARASLAAYNVPEELDALVAGLHDAIRMLR